jgi:hypothetical protein
MRIFLYCGDTEYVNKLLTLGNSKTCVYLGVIGKLG